MHCEISRMRFFSSRRKRVHLSLSRDQITLPEGPNFFSSGDQIRGGFEFFWKMIRGIFLLILIDAYQLTLRSLTLDTHYNATFSSPPILSVDQWMCLVKQQ